MSGTFASRRWRFVLREWRVVLCAISILGLPSTAPAIVPPAGALLPSTVLLLPVGPFEIVPGDSSVDFTVPDNRGGFSGKTSQLAGRITVAPSADGEAYTARVEASVDAASIRTGNGLRDASMRASFLHTAVYPSIVFAGTATAHPGIGVRPFAAVLVGALTIQNITQPIQVSVTVTALQDGYLADGRATVRMADYGIPYPRAFIFVARDPVTVALHIRARRPS